MEGKLLFPPVRFELKTYKIAVTSERGDFSLRTYPVSWRDGALIETLSTGAKKSTSARPAFAWKASASR